MKKPLIILTGPTAVGKTELSVALAKKVNGEIISADSMQVYKKMDIGTAKITEEEKGGIPHYLINELDPREDFNVVRFKEFALHYMDGIYKRNKVPIIVGGTGFYIQALLYDTYFQEEKEDSSYRDYLRSMAEQKGNRMVYEMLKSVDEEAAGKIHPNNIKRVIRALEYHYLTGEKISEHNKTEGKKPSPYRFAYFVLNQERSVLYERINKRVELMIENGLIDEVRALYEGGYGKELVSMQGIGYKELIAYFEGEIEKEEAIHKIKQDTRHFAKRQITWFKREKEVIWINRQDFLKEEELFDYMMSELKKRRIIEEF